MNQARGALGLSQSEFEQKVATDQTSIQQLGSIDTPQKVVDVDPCAAVHQAVHARNYIEADNRLPAISKRHGGASWNV